MSFLNNRNNKYYNYKIKKLNKKLNFFNKKRNKFLKNKTKISFINYRERLNGLIKHFIINKYNYILLFIVFYILSKKKSYKSLSSLFITLILGTYSAYYIHVYHHNYVKCIDMNKQSFLTSIILAHTNFHHNENISNTNPIYYIIELLFNLSISGGMLVFLYYILKICDLKIFIFSALLYTSVHMINYTLFKCPQHTIHHKNPCLNYGFDLYDIIYGTKKNMTNDIEDCHFSINIIVIFLLLYYFT